MILHLSCSTLGADLKKTIFYPKWMKDNGIIKAGQTMDPKVFSVTHSALVMDAAMQ